MTGLPQAAADTAATLAEKAGLAAAAHGQRQPARWQAPAPTPADQLVAARGAARGLPLTAAAAAGRLRRRWAEAAGLLGAPRGLAGRSGAAAAHAAAGRLAAWLLGSAAEPAERPEVQRNEWGKRGGGLSSGPV